MSDKSRIILGRDGRFRKETISTTLVNVSSDVIDKIAGSFSFIIPNLIDGWYVLCRNEETILFNKIQQFNLKTHFKPTEEGKIVPTFTPHEDTIDWCPTISSVDIPDCVFWYGIKVKMRSFIDAFFIWENTSTNRIYTPPLGNVYDDGHFCMGTAFSCPDNVSLIDQAAYALDYFQTTNWNADLLGGSSLRACERILQFDAKGNLIGDTSEWQDRLVGATHPDICDFFDKLEAI